jgi:hypothetical protein
VVSVSREDVREAVENPVSWLLAFFASAATVIGAIAIDPTGSVVAISALVLDMSTTLFTALSIAAFTIAPNVDIPGWLADGLVAGALFMGLLAILKILSSVWDRLKDEVD